MGMEGKPFGQYVHDSTQQLLADGGERRPITDADRAFFASVNQCLGHLGAPHINMTALTTIPASFPEAIIKALDMLAINQEDNDFTASRFGNTDEQERDRNLAIKALHEGLTTYQQALELPLWIAGCTIPFDEVKEEDKHSRLFKRVLHKKGDGSCHSELVEVDHIDFSKRPVIYIGGNNANSLSPRSMMSGMRQVEEVLGGADIYNDRSRGKDVEVYCIGHPANYRSFAGLMSARYALDPEHFVIPHVQESFDRFFKPHLQAAINEDTQANLTPVKRAMRQLNFLCNSYGSFCTKSLANAFTQFFEERGYSNGQTRELMREGFVACVDPTVTINVQKPQGQFSAVYVVSVNDRTSRSRSDHSRLVDSSSISTFPHIRAISDNELLVITDSPAKGLVVPTATPILPKRSNIRTEPSDWMATDKSGHNLALSTSQVFEEPKDSAIVRQHQPLAVQFSLRNAVQRRDAIGGIRELLQSTQLVQPRHPFGSSNAFTPDHTEVEAIRRAAVNSNERTP